MATYKPHLKEVYSPWYKDHPEEQGRATQEQIAGLLTGKEALPPDCIVAIDVEVIPNDTPEDQITKPLTTALKVFRQGQDDTTDYFTPRDDGRPSTGKHGKIKPGRFGKSAGYAYTMMVYGRKEGPNSLELRLGKFVNGVFVDESEPLKIPWVAKLK